MRLVHPATSLPLMPRVKPRVVRPMPAPSRLPTIVETRPSSLRRFLRALGVAR